MKKKLQCTGVIRYKSSDNCLSNKQQHVYLSPLIQGGPANRFIQGTMMSV